MDSKADMYLKRARTEIDSADLLFQASGNKEIKGTLKIDEDATFYSGAISHAYYAIFYSAKALLLTKSISTSPPEIHKRTFDEFKKAFIDTGILDARLLIIYQELIIRAETLLEIYREEKRKRGDFTYNTIPQANKVPAGESLRNAKAFYKHCSAYMASV